MSRPESERAVVAPGSAEPWTVLRIVEWSAGYLAEKRVPRARLDAELLLAHVLGLGRLDLYLQFDRPLTADERAAFRPLLKRRATREPLQYVLGSVAFRELELAVDARALIPRPETEEVVGAALAWAARAGWSDTPARRALDVGTGCGCIALALADEGPFSSIVATDRSEGALDLARANAEKTGLAGSCRFELGDLFEPVAGERFDMVVSNPPYVSETEYETLEPEVRVWEPRDALAAGPQGLDLLQTLISRAGRHLNEGGLLALEIGAGQGEAVEAMVNATGSFGSPRLEEDLSGRTRMILAEKAGSG